MGTRKSGRLGNLILLTVSVIFTLAVMETALQILDLPRQPMKPHKIKDPILVYKIPADWPGIDMDGFRNRSIPAQADIVTLGDSHTYGLNADIDSNWPGQLAKLTGLSVYNLGIGGYGPLQYYYLFDRALQLSPKYIVVGLYLPNDIKGLCQPYLRTEYWKSRAVRDGIDLSYCGNADYPDDEMEHQGKKRSGFLDKAGSLLNNSKIGVLVSISARRLRAYLPKDTEKNVVIADGRNDTVMSKSRLRVLSDSMDMKQAEIAKSLEITETLITKMAAQSRENGIEFLVMVIPSKEFVFSRYLADTSQPMSDVHQQLATNESDLRDVVFEWLKTRSIRHVDIAPALLEAVKDRGGAYPHDNDGHPLPAGYAAYAQALHDQYFSVNDSAPRAAK